MLFIRFMVWDCLLEDTRKNYNIVKVALQYKAEINISQIAGNERPDPTPQKPTVVLL